MQPAGADLDAMRRELDRVLSSRGFARNERLSRFLRFIVEHHLNDRDEELKESVLAVEVFGRSTDHDPKQDSIVRTEAGRLRSRLDDYYLKEGKDDPLIIDVPKGGYVPVFRHADPPTLAEQHASLPAKVRARRWLRLVGAAAVLIGLAASSLLWWRSRQVSQIAIAVLPIENLNHDSANEYYADGLTDELIRELSMIEGLSPRSRTSSFAMKGKNRNVREVGAALQADYIVEGSVLRSGQQLRVNVRLVRVRDEFPLWSGRFDRELTDVFVIQDEISRGITNNLRLKLGRGRRRYETSAEAYDFYLRAKSATYADKVHYYEQAIASDASFAPAYAGLAAAYAFRTGTSNFDREDELPKMRAAAEKALQLDPLLPDAYAALGEAYARDGHWEEAERSFRRSIELDPNRSETYTSYAVGVLLPLARVKDAVRQVHLAEKVDPLSRVVHANGAYVLLAAGAIAEAEKDCQKIGTGPSSAQSVCLGRVRIAQRRFEEAIRIFSEAIRLGVPPGDPIRGYLGHAYGKAGRRREAEEIAAATSPVHAFHQVLVYTGLGDRDRAVEAFERMAPQGAVRIGRALVLPELLSIRDDPRVERVRKKVGLP